MKYINLDLSRLFTFEIKKNGKIKITHDFDHKTNFAELLFDSGYRLAVLKRRNIYYYKERGELKVLRFENLIWNISRGLLDHKYHDLPDNVAPHYFLNWYKKNMPFRQTSLFKSILSENYKRISVDLKKDLIEKLPYF